MATAAERELRKLLLKIDLSAEFKIFGKMMQRQVRKNLGARRFMGGGSKNTSPFTQAITGRSSPGGSLIARIADMKPRIKKRGVSLGPSRAKKFFKMNMFIKGHSNKITVRQQKFLRALGVRAGVFEAHVLFLPTSSPPFVVGSLLLQKRRDPLHFGNMDLDKPLDMVVTRMANTWGFK